MTTPIEREVARLRREVEETANGRREYRAKLDALYERLANDDKTLTLADSLVILQDIVEQFNDLDEQARALDD